MRRLTRSNISAALRARSARTLRMHLKRALTFSCKGAILVDFSPSGIFAGPDLMHSCYRERIANTEALRVSTKTACFLNDPLCLLDLEDGILPFLYISVSVLPEANYMPFGLSPFLRGLLDGLAKSIGSDFHIAARKRSQKAFSHAWLVGKTASCICKRLVERECVCACGAGLV